MLGEVFYVAALQAWNGNWNMHGQSSPWMMIDYGLLGLVLMPVAARLIRLGLPLPARAFAYMLLIYLVEYVSGLAFSWGLGLRIWSYEGLPFNLHGQIMLYSAPIWYGLGLCAESIYRKVDAVAWLLALGIGADQLEETAREAGA